PVIPALGDLDGFVNCMVGGADAIAHRLTAIGSKVGMELDHGGARLHGIDAVDLNLVVLLGRGRKGQERDGNEPQRAANHHEYSIIGNDNRKPWMGVWENRTRLETIESK